MTAEEIIGLIILGLILIGIMIAIALFFTYGIINLMIN